MALERRIAVRAGSLSALAPNPLKPLHVAFRRSRLMMFADVFDRPNRVEDGTRWQVAMSNFSLASEMRADGIHLFESGKEVGMIKRENGQWIIYLFDKPSPITFGSLQAAQYHALACYIETVWLNEGVTTLQ